jgi:hypothetical protein
MNRHVIRYVAVVLLVWAVLDICVPGFCRTDGVHFESSPVSIVANSSHPTVPAGAPCGDDCFCCCSHVMHSPCVVLPNNSSDIAFHGQGLPGDPRLMPASLFRPPRG